MVRESGGPRERLRLHGRHPGVTRMKALARGLGWWSGLDCMIEQVLNNCRESQEAQPLPARALMQPWSWPTHPWSRLHIAFAWPMEGHKFLVVVDAHSKWTEVMALRTATALTMVQLTLENSVC